MPVRATVLVALDENRVPACDEKARRRVAREVVIQCQVRTPERPRDTRLSDPHEARGRRRPVNEPAPKERAQMAEGADLRPSAPEQRGVALRVAHARTELLGVGAARGEAAAALRWQPTYRASSSPVTHRPRRTSAARVPTLAVAGFPFSPARSLHGDPSASPCLPAVRCVACHGVHVHPVPRARERVLHPSRVERRPPPDLVVPRELETKALASSRPLCVRYRPRSRTRCGAPRENGPTRAGAPERGAKCLIVKTLRARCPAAAGAVALICWNFRSTVLGTISARDAEHGVGFNLGTGDVSNADNSDPAAKR